ncbi:MAG TPA: hypothetical protein PLE76_06760 [Rectinema sp.]|jgi:hypothetical protein|nr:hypothetical protein [Spirochaetia bacterium]MDI9426716.1 hypothetical protein [Spirochaetota bacterium]OQC75039.1 MAG: hypothetical protein BWX44_00327 [Spirochaetes bacterium ADurb.Bin001]HNP92533.1 hypothetical protein [Rectinema sp.]HNT58732.1 hypothetical protein [Rectinema sp.]
MGKNTKIPPPSKKHEDLLEGLFISPLDDSESLKKMETEEMKILSPLEGRAPLEESHSIPFDDSQGKRVFPLDNTNKREAPEISTRENPSGPESSAQEQLLLRFANELKSIKQDLLSIKEHFKVIREPQIQPSVSPTSVESPSDRLSGASEVQQQALIDEVKRLLLYLDRLLESLPEEKIEEFANSEYFNLYRHVFDELNLS